MFNDIFKKFNKNHIPVFMIQIVTTSIFWALALFKF